MPGFQKPEEFDAWKLSWELKERIVAFTATNPAARDRKFCDGILESARSAPDNRRLCQRAIGASTGLRLYLLSLPKGFMLGTQRRKNDRAKRKNAEVRTRNLNPEPEPGT